MLSVTTALVSVAEISNVFSAFAVIICLCGMVIYIARMLHEELVLGSNPRIVPLPIPQTRMVFWGVSIHDLHQLFYQPWTFLQTLLAEGTLLDRESQKRGEQKAKDPHDEELVQVCISDPGRLQLGSCPRTRYPIVVLLVRTEPVEPEAEDVVALLNTVHIRDAEFPLPTSLLGQYLKQGNGQLTCLKKLYPASGENSTPVTAETYHTPGTDYPASSVTPGRPGKQQGESEPDETGELVNRKSKDRENDSSGRGVTGVSVIDSQSSTDLCVVCQCLPVSRVLLPCRHTCTCGCCFFKLDKCPMCRSPISSYFCIQSEDYVTAEIVPQELHRETWSQWINRVNNQLNEILGFN